ncbi:amino acid ABC transporter permease [Rudaeicoccus suwonensis]|uniref:Amino acid ABC transporter membrane protein (PAAT family) n=1 Tax=Rudaeicoccus suwonensis TaxID=657409 RepID=A0A561E3S1_9MICO|nr:amino acid ABC transporter permease [Rudaeicoccus suwonensis]TWE10262.1 amino acid ABC transporter membrane protein (PAAT family) [Rudaeicoccus suwonensis]
MDAADKPRIHRRGAYEYAMWAICVIVTAGIAYTLITNPRYQWGVIRQYLTAGTVMRGLWLTIWLTVVVMVIATVLGLFVAVMRSSKILPVRLLAIGYINLFRGTPVLVQLILWFNIAALYPNIRLGIPFTPLEGKLDTNSLISATTAAIIGLSLNEAAYMAEIVRGGFNSVSKGQLEAGDSLGMSESMKMRKIIIPQAMPTVIPATGNQFISMLKETSLVSVLGVADLLQSVQLIYARTFETIPMLLVACIWYLVISILLNYPQSKIEAHYGKSTRAVHTRPTPLTEVPA